MIKVIFVILDLGSLFVSPAVALFVGIVFALTLGNPLPELSKKLAKYLLQISVVGLGFGMNMHSAIAAGKDGILFTIVSVVGVMLLGYLCGKNLRLAPRTSYLISSGTAICGGSAIAAIAPVVGADDNETSMSLATIFTLNAIALFVFPPIGRMLEMTQIEFGTWAAIAIHDTSSVVGAAAEYGEQALVAATTIKLTRALWIIPLSFVSMLFFGRGKGKVSIPYFIFLFVVAMAVNTFFPLPKVLSGAIVDISHRALSLTLFLIGGGLSVAAIKAVGARPLVFGVILWVAISVVSLSVIIF